jgi:hypothetical protein
MSRSISSTLIACGNPRIADQFPGFISRQFIPGLSRLRHLRFCFLGVINKSCDGPRHSRDDLYRYANRETELVVGAPLIDGDFNKPV